MTTNRLEAFSDGVLAIVITIMVLELKVPGGNTFEILTPLLPKFLSYLFSFIYVGIYWNNHHHMFHAIQKVNGKILWANLFLLFSLSLIPFTTGWMGENNFECHPVALYGINLLVTAISFLVLEKSAIKHEGKEAIFTKAVRSQKKEYTSLFLYISGITLSFFFPILAVIIYYIVALLWFIPDKRIEKQLKNI